MTDQERIRLSRLRYFEQQQESSTVTVTVPNTSEEPEITTDSDLDEDHVDETPQYIALTVPVDSIQTATPSVLNPAPEFGSEETELYVKMPSSEIDEEQLRHFVRLQMDKQIIVRHRGKQVGDRYFFIRCGSEEDSETLLKDMHDELIGDFDRSIICHRKITERVVS
eukprot:sb/3472395/